MRDALNKIKNELGGNLEKIADLKTLDDLRVSILGKKGELTNILKAMGSLSAEERPVMGQLANEVRDFAEKSFDERKKVILAAELEKTLAEERLDVTLAGKTREQGHDHPMTIVMEDMKRLFIGMGYEIHEGPDVETEYNNFEALNIPKNHPARDEQDTFYIEGGYVLRTQTSPVQVRVMKEGKLPIRMIAPGKVFRSDEIDATHSPVFHQIEGLVIDKNITLGDLKGTLEIFAKELFGDDVITRFRPHHFPFTEPSGELDVSCFACKGKGCRVCKDSGYIELLGCGMVHPKVLRNCGIDPDEYTGFAFGMGLERIAMQKFNITDMRLLFENDVKFLKQF